MNREIYPKLATRDYIKGITDYKADYAYYQWTVGFRVGFIAGILASILAIILVRMFP